MSNTKTSFLSLPLEMRDKIYNEVLHQPLEQSMPTKDFECSLRWEKPMPWMMQSGPGPQIVLGWLRLATTCRQVRAEMLEHISKKQQSSPDSGAPTWTMSMLLHRQSNKMPSEVVWHSLPCPPASVKRLRLILRRKDNGVTWMPISTRHVYSELGWWSWRTVQFIVEALWQEGPRLGRPAQISPRHHGAAIEHILVEQDGAQTLHSLRPAFAYDDYAHFEHDSYASPLGLHKLSMTCPSLESVTVHHADGTLYWYSKDGKLYEKRAGQPEQLMTRT